MTVKMTETTMRDGHQSLLATRMRFLRHPEPTAGRHHSAPCTVSDRSAGFEPRPRRVSAGRNLFALRSAEIPSRRSSFR